MAFARKMTGFPSDLGSFSNQTKLPSKGHEKNPVTFFTGFLRAPTAFRWNSSSLVISCEFDEKYYIILYWLLLTVEA